MHSHFNNMRSYVLGEEAGLLMAAYPHSRPQFPFSYFNEVMTGFEYTAAVGMLYEGLVDEGVQCIRNIRARYDGRKRSPFDEAECGHHYARAMASWAAVPALSGFHYSAIDKSIRWAQFDGTHFWSNGSAYGTVRQSGIPVFARWRSSPWAVRFPCFRLASPFWPPDVGVQPLCHPRYNPCRQVTADDATVGMPSLPGRDQEIVPVLPRPQIVVGDLLIRRQVFSDSLIVCVRSADPAADIHYTLNGQVPTSSDARYTKPLVLDRSCELKAIAVRKGAIRWPLRRRPSASVSPSRNFRCCTPLLCRRAAQLRNSCLMASAARKIMLTANGSALQVSILSRISISASFRP